LKLQVFIISFPCFSHMFPSISLLFVFQFNRYCWGDFNIV